MDKMMGGSSRGLSPNSLDLDGNRRNGLPSCFYGSPNAFSAEAPSPNWHECTAHVLYTEAPKAAKRITKR